MFDQIPNASSTLQQKSLLPHILLGHGLECKHSICRRYAWDPQDISSACVQILLNTILFILKIRVEKLATMLAVGKKKNKSVKKKDKKQNAITSSSGPKRIRGH